MNCIRLVDALPLGMLPVGIIIINVLSYVYELIRFLFLTYLINVQVMSNFWIQLWKCLFQVLDENDLSCMDLLHLNTDGVILTKRSKFLAFEFVYVI